MFLALSRNFRQFYIFQKSCSWKQTSNAFLDELQECAPGSPPGTRSCTGFRNLLWHSPWMLGIYRLESIQMLICYQSSDVQSLFRIFWKEGGVKCMLFHTAPPTTKHSVKICFSPFHESFDSFSYYKIVLLETTQECIPGWPPGMRSWETSRNTLLDRFWEPTLVLSLNVRYLYIGINANVNLLSILWSTITFGIFLEGGGGVKCLLFHTAPPTTKT